MIAREVMKIFYQVRLLNNCEICFIYYYLIIVFFDYSKAFNMKLLAKQYTNRKYTEHRNFYRTRMGKLIIQE